MSVNEDLERTIRKYRKKLRQIENLERLDRDLTDEEIDKILKKDKLRRELQQLLQLVSPEESSDESEGLVAAYLAEADDEEDYDASYDYVADAEDFNKIRDHEETIDSLDDSHHYETEDSPQQESPKQTQSANQEAAKPRKTQHETHIKPEIKQKELPKSEAVPTSRAPKVVAPELREGDTVPKKKAKVEQEHSKQKQSSTKNSNKDPVKDAVKSRGKSAKVKKFEVSFLEGHSDLVCCLAIDEHHLISAGRDTAIKVWDLATLKEVRSLGGHTGTVSALLLLSPAQSAHYRKGFDITDDEDQLIISASQDCSLRIWSLKSGQILKSIYTFNPVNCMTYIEEEKLIITGSGGGKISAWDILSGESITSILPVSEGVTSLQYEDDYIYSASGDGFVRAFQLQDKELHLVYVSETTRTEAGELWENLKPIRSMAVNKKHVYYGDEGSNIKVLSWKQGTLRKLRNHVTEFGSTDSIHFHGDWLLTSGYDIDSGMGYINVRSREDESYIGTISDDDTGLIMGLVCTQDSKHNTVIVTAGWELKIWTQTASPGEESIELKHHGKYEESASDSELDSASEFSDSEDNGLLFRMGLRRAQSTQDDDVTNNGWFSWCTIL